MKKQKEVDMTKELKDQIYKKALKLIDKIKYEYFECLKYTIDYYAINKDEDKRLQAGKLYNGLNKLKYLIREDMITYIGQDDYEGLNGALERYKSEFKNLLNEYKIINISKLRMIN